eukprot:GHVU01171367.1.p1 GENE.GHVU01171367.1~~GHVU01171367.1.p1  ORF type:complete len:1632 (-),score=380.45 GHVU01171367.1:856-5751(-)
MPEYEQWPKELDMTTPFGSHLHLCPAVPTPFFQTAWIGGSRARGDGVDCLPMLHLPFSAWLADAPDSYVVPTESEGTYCKFTLRVSGQVSTSHVPAPFTSVEEFQTLFREAVALCTGVGIGRVTLPRGVRNGSILLDTAISGGGPLSAASAAHSFVKQVENQCGMWTETLFYAMATTAGLAFCLEEWDEDDDDTCAASQSTATDEAVSIEGYHPVGDLASDVFSSFTFKVCGKDVAPDNVPSTFSSLEEFIDLYTAAFAQVAGVDVERITLPKGAVKGSIEMLTVLCPGDPHSVASMVGFLYQIALERPPWIHTSFYKRCKEAGLTFAVGSHAIGSNAKAQLVPAATRLLFRVRGPAPISGEVGTRLTGQLEATLRNGFSFDRCRVREYKGDDSEGVYEMEAEFATTPLLETPLFLLLDAIAHGDAPWFGSEVQSTVAELGGYSISVEDVALTLVVSEGGMLSATAVMDADYSFETYIEGDITPADAPLPFESIAHFLDLYGDAITYSMEQPLSRFTVGELVPGSVGIPTLVRAGAPPAEELGKDFESQVTESKGRFVETDFFDYLEKAGLKASIRRQCDHMDNVVAAIAESIVDRQDRDLAIAPPEIVTPVTAVMLRKLETDYKDAQKQLEHAEGERDTLRRQYEKKLADAKKADDDAAKQDELDFTPSDEKVKELEKRLEGAEEARKNAEVDSSQAKSDYDQAAADKQSADEKLAAAAAARAAAEETDMREKKRLEAFARQTELDGLKAAADEAAKLYDEAEKERAKLEKELAKARKAAEEAEKAADEAEKAADELSTEVPADEVDKLQIAAVAAEQELRDAERDLADTDAAYDKASNDLQEAQNEAADLSAQIAELEADGKDRLAALEAALGPLEDAYNEAERLYREADEERKALEKEQIMAHMEAEKAENEADEAEKAADELSEDVPEDPKIKTLEAKLSEAETAHKAAEELFDQANRDLIDAEGKLSDAQVEVSKAQTELDEAEAEDQDVRPLTPPGTDDGVEPYIEDKMDDRLQPEFPVEIEGPSVTVAILDSSQLPLRPQGGDYNIALQWRGQPSMISVGANPEGRPVHLETPINAFELPFVPGEDPNEVTLVIDGNVQIPVPLSDAVDNRIEYPVLINGVEGKVVIKVTPKGHGREESEQTPGEEVDHIIAPLDDVLPPSDLTHPNDEVDREIAVDNTITPNNDLNTDSEVTNLDQLIANKDDTVEPQPEPSQTTGGVAARSTIRIEGNITPTSVPLPFQDLNDFVDSFVDAVEECTNIPRDRIRMGDIKPGSIILPFLFTAGVPDAVKEMDDFVDQIENQLEPFVGCTFQRFCDAAGLKLTMTERNVATTSDNENFYQTPRILDSRCSTEFDLRIKGDIDSDRMPPLIEREERLLELYVAALKECAVINPDRISVADKIVFDPDKPCSVRTEFGKGTRPAHYAAMHMAEQINKQLDPWNKTEFAQLCHAVGLKLYVKSIESVNDDDTPRDVGKSEDGYSDGKSDGVDIDAAFPEGIASTENDSFLAVTMFTTCDAEELFCAFNWRGKTYTASLNKSGKEFGASYMLPFNSDVDVTALNFDIYTPVGSVDAEMSHLLGRGCRKTEKRYRLKGKGVSGELSIRFEKKSGVVASDEMPERYNVAV